MKSRLIRRWRNLTTKRHGKEKGKETMGKFIGKVIKFIVIIAVILFVLSWIVYYFNLDMKLASVMEPIMNKHYDRMKRDKKL